MSKSVFKWTSDGVIDVEHRGETVTVNVPEWMTGDLVNDPSGFLDKIRNTLDDRTIVHRILSQLVIDLRAACRPQDSNEKPQAINAETARNIAAKWAPKPVNVPKQAKSDEEEAEDVIAKLKAKGYSNKKIKEKLGL